MNRTMDSLDNRHVDDDIIDTLPDVAESLGISTSTLRRQIARGEGPPVVRLSARRLGIMRGDRRRWISDRRRAV